MKKLNLLLLASLFLSYGCSRLDLALKFVNTYVVYKADDYFDLTSAQKNWLRVEFEKDFTKIKSQIIPKASNELYRLSKIVQEKKEFTEIEVAAEFDLLNKYLYETVKVFSPNAIIFAGLLTPDQVDTFQKNYRKKLNNLKEDFNQEKSTDRLTSSFDNWFGELLPSQEKQVVDFVKINPQPVDLIVRDRQKILGDFKESFSNESKRSALVEKIFTDYNSLLEPSYISIREARNKNLIKLVTIVLNSMTNDQRNQLSTNLVSRANQLSKIN